MCFGPYLDAFKRQRSSNDLFSKKFRPNLNKLTL